MGLFYKNPGTKNFPKFRDFNISTVNPYGLPNRILNIVSVMRICLGLLGFVGHGNLPLI